MFVGTYMLRDMKLARKHAFIKDYTEAHTKLDNLEATFIPPSSVLFPNLMYWFSLTFVSGSPPIKTFLSFGVGEV